MPNYVYASVDTNIPVSPFILRQEMTQLADGIPARITLEFETTQSRKDKKEEEVTEKVVNPYTPCIEH